MRSLKVRNPFYNCLFSLWSGTPPRISAIVPLRKLHSLIQQSVIHAKNKSKGRQQVAFLNDLDELLIKYSLDDSTTESMLLTKIAELKASFPAWQSDSRIRMLMSEIVTELTSRQAHAAGDETSTACSSTVFSDGDVEMRAFLASPHAFA